MSLDLHYAIRALRRAPGAALLAVLTLALGVGANTAIFSVTRAVLLQPFPYPEPDRLMRITESRRGAFLNVSYPNFLDWRERSRTFESMAICLPLGSAVMSGPERAEVVLTGRTEGRLFDVLGMRPALGRLFAEAEERPGAARVAIISDRLWRRRFGGRADAIGQPITLDGQPVTVVGVLPASFDLYRIDAWYPLVPLLQPGHLDRANHPAFAAFGRLRPGVAVDAARRELASIAADLQQRYPASNAEISATARPLVDTLVGDARTTLLLLAAAVVLVLLIACANVANVLLARGLHRSRETSVRAALGASRFRLVRLFLCEGLVLALAGAASGVLIAAWTVRALRGVPGLTLPRLADATVDTIAVAFAVALSVATTVLFALVPAVRLASSDLMTRLRQGGVLAGAPASGGTLRATFLAAQVALSLMLLVGAALMLRTIDRILSVDPGFDVDRVMSVAVVQSPQSYRGETELLRFSTQALEEIRAVPGVADAAIAFPLSIVGATWTPQVRVDGQAVTPGHEPAPLTTAVTPGYFKTMGIVLRRGRLFDAREAAGDRVPVIVSETFVRQILERLDPIGTGLTSRIPQMARMEIVGVVEDTRRGTLLTGAAPELYVPYDRVPVSDPTILVRAASGDPLLLARSVDARIATVDAGIPSIAPRRLADAMELGYRDRRVLAGLLTVFATLALALTGIGIAGIVSFIVARRTQEIGLRIALGARSGAVVGLVMRGVLVPVGLGVAAGALGTMPASRLLRSFLHQVSPTDPYAVAVAAGTLLGAAALAAYLPARRAARIDPLSALRES